MKILIAVLVAVTVALAIYFTWVNTATAQDVYPQIEINHPNTPQEIIMAIFKSDSKLALSIARAESTLCLRKINPASSARGCYQILKGTWKNYACQGDSMIDLDNIRCAKKIFDRSGTNPWNESKKVWGK